MDGWRCESSTKTSHFSHYVDIWREHHRLVPSAGSRVERTHLSAPLPPQLPRRDCSD